MNIEIMSTFARDNQGLMVNADDPHGIPNSRYLKATQARGINERFIRQFPAGFDPLGNYQQAALDLVNWLQENDIELADGYTFENLRSGVSHIKDAENELLYFFNTMALGNAESNPAYPIFARCILLAEQALALKDMFP
ncbi:hypothetical protein [Rhizobium sp. MHM7A]|uniref:hypothetical protein n=1 Tax=Rhizobium sp. MHM7A TaxID=2583233 RepID=UPI001105AC97|nr:hypothetical protein [Rhizobium sp. MHM7A]TLX16470.1 hypothetical protein FFR93_03800 [Rhizobium sp. MHM7A]